jgi:hypothetical protein
MFLPLQEEIQKKTGYIVMLDDGTFDVDANTSIDHLSEELGVKIPEVLFLVLSLLFLQLLFTSTVTISVILDIAMAIKLESWSPTYLENLAKNIIFYFPRQNHLYDRYK